VLLQATHFYEVVEYKMGWSNLLLRKQLFKAFDLEGHGDITFTEFCEGYSTMLRGTVPELQEFAWRVYHIQGDSNLLSLTDVSALIISAPFSPPSALLPLIILLLFLCSSAPLLCSHLSFFNTS
jgi:hypothetical protein